MVFMDQNVFIYTFSSPSLTPPFMQIEKLALITTNRKNREINEILYHK